MWRKGRTMYIVQITAMTRAAYPELSALYENPLENPCSVEVGQVFFARNAEKPKELCESAWQTMQPFVLELAQGGGNFFDGWMKNPKTAMVSCNDGFRPVSFFLRVLDAEADPSEGKK